MRNYLQSIYEKLKQELYLKINVFNVESNTLKQTGLHWPCLQIYKFTN